jgi:L-lactate dehydrogenase
MKIGIVGTGMVGSTAAYAMVVKGIGREIVLVDRNDKRSRAEAYDILHAVPFTNPLNIRSGHYADLKGCRMVIISAGVSQKPGESRLDLLQRNAAVFKDVVPKILEHTPHTVLVVATNPLDVMTHLAARYAADFDVPRSRVLGTGTMLDTARFRSLLAERLGVDPQHVHAYVIGEHGDSEVLTWSLATVSAMHINEYCEQQEIRLDKEFRKDVDHRVRNAAYAIIQGKGATYFGIGGALAKLADVILHDQRSVLTISSPDTVAGVADVSVSLPRIVGGNGVLQTLHLPLSDEESDQLRQSTLTIKEAIDEIVG